MECVHTPETFKRAALKATVSKRRLKSLLEEDKTLMKMNM